MSVVVSRLLASTLLAGCSSGATKTLDAAPAVTMCGDLDEGPPPGSCVASGLATIDLDGTWSFTGTFVDYDGFRRDFTAPAMLAVIGAGYCNFSLSYSLAFDMNRSFAFDAGGDLTTYVDDTAARAGANLICMNAAGSLQLSYSDTMHVGEGNEFRSIDGTLTR